MRNDVSGGAIPTEEKPEDHKYFTIATWNANGLIHKVDLVEPWIKLNNVESLGISETKTFKDI